MFAEVILSKVNPGIDKIYHYSIPEGLEGKLQVGQQILVPFGKRKEVGYLVGFTKTTDIKVLKPVIEILSPYQLFSDNTLKIARWMAEYYNSFLITALRTVMPPGMLIKERRALSNKRTKPLYKESKTSDIKLRSGTQVPRQQPFELTDDQKKAMGIIRPLIEGNKHDTVLLYGITGSGKTEVYIRSIEAVLEKGKSAMILVPEIGLTPLMIERFRERFSDGIALYHSEMSVNDRTEEWERIASGEAKVILGTRTAIFTPVKDLGLIVIDEEYENTYKQEQNPRYHARDVAQKLAELSNAVVILGTATPSVETFYKAKSGEYKMARLPVRIDNRPLPPVEIVDMKAEIKKGNRGILSSVLKAEIKKTLEKRKQVILFMNRRGYFTFVMCRECGYTVECPKCSVPLVYYMNEKQLRCNYCNFRTPAPFTCPKCQSSSIKYFGTGTQRIEKEVVDIFPYARIIRLDRDTVSKKGAYEKAIKVFVKGEADVLIGTQIVTKGLDLESVTLVGAVSADVGLNAPDFRSAEHTFQLLTQVAGRAGRHYLPGKVVIQTYYPDHYAIRAASAHDYEKFYDEEIKNREELGFPPFSRLINIVITNPDEEKAKKLSKDLQTFFSKRQEKFEILGPSRAFIPRLRGEFRYQMILKGENIGEMRRSAVESINKVVKLGNSRINIDIDPQNLL